MITKFIPELRCAKTRHLGSRENVTAARKLYKDWLTQSNEKLSHYPIFFHYVNVGPDVIEQEIITDVYLAIF